MIFLVPLSTKAAVLLLPGASNNKDASSTMSALICNFAKGFITFPIPIFPEFWPSGVGPTKNVG